MGKRDSTAVQCSQRSETQTVEACKTHSLTSVEQLLCKVAKVVSSLARQPIPSAYGYYAITEGRGWLARLGRELHSQ